MFSIKKCKRQLQESSWLLGICEKGFDDLKAGHIHWINNGEYEGKKWFADPFILNYDDHKIHLLVEEFDYKIHRGRIAKLTIDRNCWTVIDCKIILDLETHLSFPMIWRQGDDIFVCPENYHSGGWSMYRYDSSEEKLVFVQQIIGEKLTDATIWKDSNTYFLLSTYYPTPNGRRLTIWKSDSLRGKYEKYQEILFDENIGRNAGMIFPYEDKYIRPAQESNFSYGHSLVFQSVNNKDGFFSFDEINRNYSSHKLYNVGMHTYNQHISGMAVVDAKGWRYPIVGRIIKFVGNVLVSFHLKEEYRPQ